MYCIKPDIDLVHYWLAIPPPTISLIRYQVEATDLFNKESAQAMTYEDDFPILLLTS